VECDSAVNGKQLTGSAKWEDILKVYDVDMYCVLPAAKSDWETREALFPECDKISLSAPIISSTVAAAINTLVIASRDNCTVNLNDA
jgi:hypothetical protein